MEIWQMGAARLAASIRARELSSREVVEAHLKRIEAVNPAVNALRLVLAEEALAAADDADRRPADGALHGVPFSVKENIDVAGTASTWGVRGLQEAVVALDAPAVANLRAAGAIPLARGNMPDFALRWHTDNALAGATLNPWDAGRTAGGSSGGDAVALATGMVPLALGNDIGGSLRWPSQCNGTVALRPTAGRIPDAGLVPTPDSALSVQQFNVQGPMAREVADLRVALAALSAPSPRDPWYVPGAETRGPRRVSVALPADTAPEIAGGVRAAAHALAGAGYDVAEALPPEPETAAHLWAALLNHDVRRDWPAMRPLVCDAARRFTETELDATPEIDAGDGWVERQRIARAWSLHQADRPLILAPVCLHGPFAPDADLEDPRALLRAMRLVVPVNLLGLPSLALPAGRGPDGLPLGVQLIGPRFGEGLCLDAAAVVEAALGTLTPIDPVQPGSRPRVSHHSSP